MTLPFRYYTRVRYQDCDAQNVVFNARYGDYVDLAVTEFLRASFPGRDPFDGSLEVQVVRQLIEWKAPARFNDVLEISVRASRIGTTSVTIGSGVPAIRRSNATVNDVVPKRATRTEISSTSLKRAGAFHSMSWRTTWISREPSNGSRSGNEARRNSVMARST